jgi:hypothetical protein
VESKEKLMRKIPILACLLVGILGCETTAPNISSSNTQLFTQSASRSTSVFERVVAPQRFRDAVNRENWDAANEIYQQHVDLLEKSSPNEVARLASSTNIAWSPRLAAASEEIKAALLPHGFNPVRVKEVMSKGKSTLSEYESLPILANEARRSKEAYALRQEIESVPTQLAAAFNEIVANYDHAASPILIDELSVSVPNEWKKAVVLLHIKDIAHAIEISDSDKASALAKSYGALLGSSDRKPLDEAYVARYLRAGGPSATIDQLVKASSAARAIGSTTLPLPAFLIGNAKDILPVTIDGVPIKTTIDAQEIAGLTSRAAAADEPFLLVIDTARTYQTRSLIDPKTIPLQREVGTKKVINVEYRRAQASVHQAERALREAESENSTLQLQSGAMVHTPNAGALGAVLGGFTSAMGKVGVSHAQKDLERAQKNAANTPEYISEKSYETINVASATERTALSGEIVVYLINTKDETAKVLSEPVKKENRESRKSEEITAWNPNQVSTPKIEAASLKLETIAQRSAAAPMLQVADLANDIDIGRQKMASVAKIDQDVAAKLTATTQATLMQLPPPKNASEGALTKIGAKSANGEPNSGGAAAACRTTTAFLAQRIPRLDQPALAEVRTQILDLDISEMMRNATREGFSQEGAIKAAFDQSREFDKTTKEALITAGATDGFGTTDEEFLSKLNNGSLRVAECDGIRNASLCAAIATKMQSIAFKAIGAEMSCHSRNGSWAK